MSDPIARLRGLLQEASPGPWMLVPLTELQMFDDDRHMHAIQRSGLSPHGFDEILRDRTKLADVRLIVAAVNSLPALLAVAELAQRMVNLGHDGEAYNRTFIDIEEALAELADATGEGM